MSYIKNTNQFLSSNGLTDITYYVYEPKTEPAAMFQISHGMCEYVERYEPFIEFLTDNGCLVFGNDHLGHKNSVQNQSDLGYMAHKDGWKCLYRDVLILADKMKEAHPRLPLVLFGHSMGSFVARAAVANAPKRYDGAIFCGTGGTNPAAGMGKKLISLVRFFKGERYRSPLLKKLFAGSYNKRYDNVRTSFDWLCHDEEVVDQYMKDEYCFFDFTTSAYYDLVSILDYVSSDEWYDKIPVSLPIFLISGEMDPVGNWSKGILEVDSRLRKSGREDYQMKLYSDMRHEILNEVGKETVYEDILNWLKNHIKGVQNAGSL